MTKEKILEILELSSGHPYFQLWQDRITPMVTVLEQNSEVTQEEAVWIRGMVDFKKNEAIPMNASYYKVLTVLNTPRAKFMIRDFKIHEIKKVRDLCDAYVRYFKRLNLVEYEKGSRQRFAYLWSKCQEVKRLLGEGKDFWLAYQHLDYLVTFCVQNKSVSVKDPQFAPIRNFLGVLHDYAMGTVLDMGKAEAKFSTNFTDSPEGNEVEELFRLKKEFLVEPERAMSEKWGSPEKFRGLLALEEDPRVLRLQVLSVFGSILESGGADYSVLGAYDSTVLYGACVLCREVHATLNNEAIYHEMYVLEKEFFLQKVRRYDMDQQTRNSLRGQLLDILEGLHEDKIIGDEEYFREVRCLDE